MERVIKRSYAKINLSLDVLSKRLDGMHNIDTVMQLVDLKDTLYFHKGINHLHITSNLNSLPVDDTNLVYKAWKLMKGHYQGDPGMDIHIEKVIPVAAGLAGGSSNAAITMRTLNDLWGLNLNKLQLMKMARQIGADVPYFFEGKTCRARGIGDELEVLPSFSDVPVLLVNNGQEISTAYVYRHLLVSGQHSRMERVVQCLKRKDIKCLVNTMYNTMESVAVTVQPEIVQVKAKLMELGALGSLMSGSGPTVFGLFPNSKSLQKGYDYFSKFYKHVYQTKTIGGIDE